MKTTHLILLSLLVTFFGFCLSPSLTSYAKAAESPKLQLEVTIKDLTSGELYDNAAEFCTLEPWHTYEVSYTCSNPTPDVTAYDLYINLQMPAQVGKQETSFVSATVRSTNADPGIIVNRMAFANDRDLFLVIDESYDERTATSINTQIGRPLNSLGYDSEWCTTSTTCTYIFQAVPRWSLNLTTLICWLETPDWHFCAAIAIGIALFVAMVNFAKHRNRLKYLTRINELERANQRLTEQAELDQAEIEGLSELIPDGYVRHSKRPTEPTFYTFDKSDWGQQSSKDECGDKASETAKTDPAVDD